MGPSMVAFLREVYGRAKEADKFLMSQQPPEVLVEHDGSFLVLGHALEHSMRSHGCRYQNRIILHDNTLNLPVVARQPYPDPNYTPHAAARRVAGA